MSDPVYGIPNAGNEDAWEEPEEFELYETVDNEPMKIGPGVMARGAMAQA